jgi:hypothetical protein
MHVRRRVDEKQSATDADDTVSKAVAEAKSNCKETRMSDLSIVQEFFDVPRIGRKCDGPISVDDLVISATALRDLARKGDTNPSEIVGCLKKLLLAIGLQNLLDLIDIPPKCDDHWADWCPSPAGVQLHKADCPAGTTPLWSNGKETVFYRLTKDKHGNDVMGFGVHKP